MTARELLDETSERLETPNTGLNWLVAGLLEAIVKEGLERLQVDADHAEVDLVESDATAWGRAARWVVLRSGRRSFQALFSVGDDAALGMLPAARAASGRVAA